VPWHANTYEARLNAKSPCPHVAQGQEVRIEINSTGHSGLLKFLNSSAVKNIWRRKSQFFEEKKKKQKMAKVVQQNSLS
jgi:hypothetical protein